MYVCVCVCESVREREIREEMEIETERQTEIETETESVDNGLYHSPVWTLNQNYLLTLFLCGCTLNKTVANVAYFLQPKTFFNFSFNILQICQLA